MPGKLISRRRLVRAGVWLLEYGTMATIVVVAEHPLGLFRRLTQVDPTAQRTAFAAAAGAMAIIAGFIVTTTFFFAAASDSSSLGDFRRQWGPRLNRVLVVALCVIVFSVGLMVAAILSAPLLVTGYLVGSAVVLVITQLAKVAVVAWAMLQARYRDQLLTPVSYPSDKAA